MWKFNYFRVRLIIYFILKKGFNNMYEIKITNFEELNKALQRYNKDSNRWVFRGQENVLWGLIPKVGRSNFNMLSDKSFFSSWKRRAREFTSTDYSSEWDWLSLAQHHGLPTRLLDWSINPLVATFFAVNSDRISNVDAVIYAYGTYNFISKTSNEDPFEDFEEIVKFKPSGITQRLTRQYGVFTVHNPPDKDLINNLVTNDKLERIIIDKNYKKQLRFDLSFYGINAMTIFPDLDGLSQYMEWHMINSSYWSGEKVK